MPLSIGRPCGNETTEITGPYFSLRYYQGALPLGSCSVASISQISTNWFRDEEISLSSALVNFKEKENFPVLNQNNDIIGAILGDGIVVTAQGQVSWYYLCIQKSRTDYDDDLYETQDFGTTDNGYTYVTPLNLKVGSTTSQICAWIAPVSGEAVFPIARVEDCQDATEEFYSTEVTNLIYSLASMFLISSAFGFFILVDLIRYSLKSHQFLLIFFLIAFNTSKNIYAHISPNVR